MPRRLHRQGDATAVKINLMIRTTSPTFANLGWSGDVLLSHLGDDEAPTLRSINAPKVTSLVTVPDDNWHGNKYTPWILGSLPPAGDTLTVKVNVEYFGST